jgi:Na+-translocating ferredoxin:NAD+ oxidoreductase subunit G
MPGFSRLERESVMPETGGDSLIFFKGYENDKNIGVAVNTYTTLGYSGLIKMMVGFQADGTINNFEVLEHKETPGLGTKMTEPAFKEVFQGKNPATFTLKVEKDGGDVDAITAATITSRAVCDAIQRAYDTYEEMKKENK